MRKVILISLSMFIAVVASGYCITWFAQAAQIKRGIEQAIAQVNAQQKYITYDTIETSGFPSDIFVSIVRPHFAGRIDPFLKIVAAKTHPGQPDATPTIPEWNEDALLDGRLIIGVNALSDKYSLRISGNWQRNSTISGKAISIAAQSSGDSACTLQMAHSGGIFGTLWDYHGLVRDNPKDFLTDLRMLDCGGMANVISDTTSHATLMSNGPWRFYISNTPQDAKQQARLYVKISDMEVTPQGDEMMAIHRNAFSPNAPYPIQYSLFGKENIEIDFSYAGPSDLQAAGKNPPLDIELGKFVITNQMYTSNMTLSLTNGMSGIDRVSRLAFKAESNFNEQYDTFLQNLVHNFVGQLYADKAPQSSWLQPYLQKYKPDELYAIIAPAIPNLHSLGQLMQALDISYKGASDLSAGDVTLSDLNISTSAYGIKGNGNVKRTEGQLVPEGQTVLTCSNCPRLVDEVTGYAARLQKTMSYFQTPEQNAATTPIDSKLVEGVKGFLKALAAPIKESDPDKDSFVYAIVSDGKSGVTINNKNVSDVLAMYKEYLGSVLKEHANITPATASAPASTPAPAH